MLSRAKKRIQDETQTTITCSKVKSDGISKRVVEVKGTNHGGVYAARQQIKSIGNVAPKRELPTHFTCIKVTNSTIKENYLKFKVFIIACTSEIFFCQTIFTEENPQENILNDETTPELHESIFMRPEKLHLTFGVMCLTEHESCQQAKQLLADCLLSTVE